MNLSRNDDGEQLDPLLVRSNVVEKRSKINGFFPGLQGGGAEARDFADDLFICGLPSGSI